MADESSSPNPSAAFEPPNTTAVSLIGFMGAGKTTVGQVLATRLGWRFVDLDELIQARDGRTIQQIFEQSGEDAFRALERELLQTAVGNQAGGTVLSLGGGAFIDNTNQRLLRENGIPAVFLDAPVEELLRRCAQPGIVRPLLRDREHFCSLYEQRRPAYMKASFRIETAGKEVGMIVEEIICQAGLRADLGASK